MKKVIIFLSLLFVLVACSNENGDNDEVNITKAYVEENAEVGLTYNEVRERFGTAVLTGNIDNMEAWLYDSSHYNDFEYITSLEDASYDDIKSGNLDYQLFINFIDEKAILYTYFYVGEDGLVWKYQITPEGEPFNNPAIY